METGTVSKRQQLKRGLCQRDNNSTKQWKKKKKKLNNNNEDGKTGDLSTFFINIFYRTR